MHVTAYVDICSEVCLETSSQQLMCMLFQFQVDRSTFSGFVMSQIEKSHDKEYQEKEKKKKK